MHCDEEVAGGGSLRTPTREVTHNRCWQTQTSLAASAEARLIRSRFCSSLHFVAVRFFAVRFVAVRFLLYVFEF